MSKKFVLVGADGFVRLIARVGQPPPTADAGDSVIEVNAAAAVPPRVRESDKLKVEGSVFSWLDTRPLAVAKADKQAEMKVARDAKRDGGFTVSGNAFDSDAESRANIQLNYLQAVNAKADSLPFTVTWTLADDSDVVLNRGQMIAVGDGLQRLLDNAQTRYQARKAAIAAAPDLAALALIIW